MEDVVITSGVRTAIGKFQGSLADVPASDLGAHVIREAVARAGIDPANVDHVVMGIVGQVAEDAYLSRHAAVLYTKMSLIERIQKNMVEAMKAKQETRLAAVRFIKTALLKYKADNMKEADEQAAQQLLNTLLKQRRESADMFRKGGREELAAKEEAEITVIEGYMPAMATDADIDAALAAALAETGITSAKQMGVVMKAVQAHLAGKRVDGKALSDKVRARLGERA